MNNVLYRNRNNKNYEGGIILVHGRGAGAADIISLADEFRENSFLIAAPQANGNTWYPYSFMAPIQSNEPYLGNSLQMLDNVFSEMKDEGIDKEKILLIGFSQGACLSLEYAFRNQGKYGGIAALSGALITEDTSGKKDMNETPVFLGCSERDPHIPVERVYQTERIFNSSGALVTTHIYKGSFHGVIQDEIDFIRKNIENLKNS